MCKPNCGLFGYQWLQYHFHTTNSGPTPGPYRCSLLCGHDVVCATYGHGGRRFWRSSGSWKNFPFNARKGGGKRGRLTCYEAREDAN